MTASLSQQIAPNPALGMCCQRVFSVPKSNLLKRDLLLLASHFRTIRENNGDFWVKQSPSSVQDQGLFSVSKMKKCTNVLFGDVGLPELERDAEQKLEDQAATTVQEEGSRDLGSCSDDSTQEGCSSEMTALTNDSEQIDSVESLEFSEEITMQAQPAESSECKTNDDNDDDSEEECDEDECSEQACDQEEDAGSVFSVG